MPRLAWVFAPAALLAAALVAVVAGLLFGGGAAPAAFADPGAVVRWGLPVVRALFDLSVAATLGALVLAVWAVDAARPEFGRALDLAAAAAGAWTVLAAACGFLSFQSVYVTAPSLDASYGDALGDFLTNVSLGQAWLVTAITGAVLSAACVALRNVTALGVLTVAAVLALVPLGQQGHDGGLENHNIAVTALYLHLIGAAVWVGGLLALGVLRPVLGDRIATVLPRYSSIALVCFVVVGFSGVVSAAVRVGDWPGLLTPFGALIAVKSVALVALGLFGAWQRRALIPRIAKPNGKRAFWVFATAEIAVMGIASGVAAALARTPPPTANDTIGTSPAEILTGSPLPSELTPGRWITEWSMDPLWALGCAFGLVLYLAAVRRLRRRGDAWPWYRTLAWIAGVVLLAWTTNGAPNVYQDYLFSVHMLAHMLLTMAVPILLVAAAPVTLALRAVAARTDGSRGTREWILLIVHSRVSRVLTNPIVAAILFAGSLWLFYYTGLLRWAVVDHVGHEWMTIHFLLTGFLFAEVLVGVDPLPGRPAYPLRLILLLATMAFHAFFGLSIMSSTGLFLADWYGAMGREWGLTPIVDQQWGGGIAWSVGEIPTVILAIFVAVSWSRSDAREARRRDRNADRTGDAELEAYNRMLAERGRRDAGSDR